MTPKQQAFVREYLIDLNATQAAIRSGYSVKTAQMIGSENLSKPIIAQAIAEATEQRAEKLEISALWVLQQAKETYEAARFADKLSEAVSALKLVGTHVDVQAFKDRTSVEHSVSEESAKWLGR
jgi:phage terminase small subunit